MLIETIITLALFTVGADAPDIRQSFDDYVDGPMALACNDAQHCDDAARTCPPAAPSVYWGGVGIAQFDAANNRCTVRCPGGKIYTSTCPRR